MANTDSELDFAYKYPFSNEAKSIVSEIVSGRRGADEVHLAQAKEHIESMLTKGLRFVAIGSDYLKKDYLLTYLYSRMLVSLSYDGFLIDRFAESEAKRSAEATKLESSQNVARICAELDMHVDVNGGEYSMGFVDFLKNRPARKEYSLVNQRLEKGKVFLDRNEFAAVLEVMFKKRVREGLPINQKELPKEVLLFYKSNGIRITSHEGRKKESGQGIGWVERLLDYPILDGRHRIVNLVLAPYFVNVRKLEVDDAVKRISDYIEKCRKANPDTKIDERYIRYQCMYAKKKGSRVLSAKKARELLGDEVMDRIEQRQ
jgi:hypothetical protein